uniref:Fibronectin type-III domain-containing protein n=1 Tax=Amphimedon queenslandica TaxID=400682 RepID=A0A1X7ST01_AMPQE
MATASIYWCLVLAGCTLNLVVSMPSVFQFTQTSPAHYSIVCPGNKLVLTCIVKFGINGGVIWKGDKGNTQLLPQPVGGSLNAIVDSFFVNITHSNSTTVTSTATNYSASVTLDGANVSCFADGATSKQLTIDISNLPGSVKNVSVDPIDNNTLSISWIYKNYEEEHCITAYTINVSAEYDGTLHNTIKSASSNPFTIPSLIIGTNYSFIIIPIDTIGREGPPSSLIQYIWNVPAQVVNISWDQISTDTITIWWNNTQV